MYYCDHCEHKTTAVRRSMTRTVKVHGTDITVKYEGLFCERCGAELYDDAVEQTVFNKTLATYRHSITALSPNDVSSLLSRYSAEELASIAKCTATEIINASHGGVLARDTDRKLKELVRGIA